MYTVYILYSELLSKYYVGFTSMSVSDRLVRHMQDHGGFTSKAKDWEILHTEVYADKREALQIEKIIKKRGARRYLDQKDKSDL